MQLSNIPGKLVLPFANGGGKNTIPVASQIGITAGAASLVDGFPPLTRTPIAAGGVPPSGLDMNGILYELSAVIRWANAGGGYPFDSTFATDTNVGGYPKGARIMRADGAGYWYNTTDNNVTDPESSGAAAAGWVPDFTTGVAAVTMTSANVTLTPAQYGKPVIVISGALTGNLNLIFPNIVGRWLIINITTGNFVITAKTAAGTGASCSGVGEVFGDGVNIYSSNSFTQNGANAVTRDADGKLSESVSPEDYMTQADRINNDLAPGNTNVTYSFAAALVFCKANGKALELPGKAYKLTAGALNFAATGLAIVGKSKPQLIFEGSGQAFVSDTELADGNTFSNMRVENLIIVGNPNITDGFYNRGIVRSVFRNIEVRECSEKAFHIKHGVSNLYDSFKYSGNEVVQTTRPAHGFYLTNNGTGYYTADCTFINPISEDFPLGLGCYVHDGSGNVFVGGTFEGCNIGLTVDVGSRRNHFINTWCEANGTRDIEVNSTANTFDDCYFGSACTSPNVEITTGKGTIFRGGYIRTANLQSASSDTLFNGCGFDQNLTGTLGITGPGSYRIFSATKIDSAGNVVGNLNDKLGVVAGLTLADGLTFPATYVASSNPNTLDDYEEGTWTATLVPTTSGSITLDASFQTGFYTKVGRLVTISGLFYVNSVSSPLGELTIEGLPFPINSSTSASRISFAVRADNLDVTATGQIVGMGNTGESKLYVKKYNAGVLSALASQVKANSDFWISATFVTN